MEWTRFKRLCECAAIPGREDAMRELVRAELDPLVDEMDTDVMGNLIGVRNPGGGRKVMIAAHMDEIGFYVKFIDDNGFLRISPVGGFDPRQLFAQRVIVTPVEGEPLRGVLAYSTKPTHLLRPEEKQGPPVIDKFFVDVGLSPDAVKERVSVGDMVTLDREWVDCGDTLVAKAIDNRVGVFVMIEALRAVQDVNVEIHAVATVQEEVGLRGATTSAYAINPDVSIALDTTLACDHPGPGESDRVTTLGGGVGIKILDSSLISHPKLVRHFRDLAERHEIPHQMEILPRGGTDAGAMQRTRGGNASITLSVPTRYIHTSSEMTSRKDVEAAVSLLSRYLEDAHNGDYRF